MGGAGEHWQAGSILRYFGGGGGGGGSGDGGCGGDDGGGVLRAFGRLVIQRGKPFLDLVWVSIEWVLPRVLSRDQLRRPCPGISWVGLVQDLAKGIVL